MTVTPNVNFLRVIYLLKILVKNYVHQHIQLTFLLYQKDWMIQGLQDETYVLLMDDDGEMREDLQLPNETYKTDDDMKNSVLIKDYCEQVNNGENIDIFL